MRILTYALVMMLALPALGWTKTIYVRPSDDGAGNALTYGTGTGASNANAFAGFAAITGVAAGDTICLPGNDEPFYERLNYSAAGTSPVGVVGESGNLVTIKGCGSTKALIWSAQSLTGSRSFNSSRVAVSDAAYDWANPATDIYRKKIDYRPRMLWENSTWLRPRNLDALSEATILAGLQPGEWGVKNNGDSTYRIYYRATVTGNSPSNTTIRCNHIPLADGSLLGIAFVGYAYVELQDIEIRGHTATTQARAFATFDSSHTRLTRVEFWYNEVGPNVQGVNQLVDDTIWKDVKVMYSSNTGIYGLPGAGGLKDWTIDGGEFSYTRGTTFNGTNFTSGDGDGIGIGQGGGNLENLIIKNIKADYNANYGIYPGTSNPMTITNLSILSSTFHGNGKGCFAEPAASHVIGAHSVIGFICSGTKDAGLFEAMYFGTPSAARTLTVANGVFARNQSYAELRWQPHADNNVTFRNLVFEANPGKTGSDYADLYSSGANLIGDEVFDKIWFNSDLYGPRYFARLGTAPTRYQYNIFGNLADFNTATGATGTVVNTDPLFVAPGNYHLQNASPLRNAGTSYAACIGMDGSACSATPSIGAYQTNPLSLATTTPYTNYGTVKTGSVAR